MWQTSQSDPTWRCEARRKNCRPPGEKVRTGVEESCQRDSTCGEGDGGTYGVASWPRGLVASEVLTSNSCRDSSGCCSKPHYSMSRSGGQSSWGEEEKGLEIRFWTRWKDSQFIPRSLVCSYFFALLYTPLSSALSFSQLVLWFLCLPSPARPAAVPSHLSGL